jgi:hypothetical protein
MGLYLCELVRDIYFYIQEYTGVNFSVAYTVTYLICVCCPLNCKLRIPQDFVRFVACVCLFPFSGHIHRYNSLNGQPDILRSLYSALQPSNTLEDRRYNCIRHRKYTDFFMLYDKFLYMNI